MLARAGRVPLRRYLGVSALIVVVTEFLTNLVLYPRIHSYALQLRAVIAAEKGHFVQLSVQMRRTTQFLAGRRRAPGAGSLDILQQWFGGDLAKCSEPCA